jgi:hypothetical protein
MVSGLMFITFLVESTILVSGVYADFYFEFYFEFTAIGFSSTGAYFLTILTGATLGSTTFLFFFFSAFFGSGSVTLTSGNSGTGIYLPRL